MKISRLLEIAAKEAEKSSHPKSRHGAIALSGKTIVGKGHNAMTGDRLMARECYGCGWVGTQHAETMAIKRAKLRLGLTLVVVRFDTYYRMSKPCSKCQDVLRRFGVKRVYYSTGEGAEYKVFRPRSTWRR